MEKFLQIVSKAIELNATDIHLVNGCNPIYRVNKSLISNTDIEPMNKFDLESLMEELVNDSLELVEQFEDSKKLDLPFELNDNVRLRINASMASNVPTFSIRIIRNKQLDIDELNLRSMIDMIRKNNTGLILITGKVNSGKTTTLNALVQEINKTERKKIVMLEEPIEYTHKPDKAIIVQKEVNRAGDVNSYYDGIVNLLREDADIAIIGEIRDRKTMEAALELSEAGGLVIGTLHTRSCGETIDRIIGMYEPNEQKAIKYSLSSVLKTVVSQKIVKSNEGKLILVPEIMVVTPTISALIRQDKFSISEIQDAIHHSTDKNMISFERSFVNLYNEHKVNLDVIKSNVEEENFKLINNLIGGRY